MAFLTKTFLLSPFGIPFFYIGYRKCGLFVLLNTLFISYLSSSTGGRFFWENNSVYLLYCVNGSFVLYFFFMWAGASKDLFIPQKRLFKPFVDYLLIIIYYPISMIFSTILGTFIIYIMIIVRHQ